MYALSSASALARARANAAHVPDSDDQAVLIANDALESTAAGDSAPAISREGTDQNYTNRDEMTARVAMDSSDIFRYIRSSKNFKKFITKC